MNPSFTKLPIRRLPAFLAAAVVLFWPAFADARCCCKRAEMQAVLETPCLDRETGETGSRKFACPKCEAAAKTKRCGGGPDDPSGIDGPSTNRCDCDDRCCTVLIAVPSQPTRLVDLDWTLFLPSSHELEFHKPAILNSTQVEFNPVSLSAQEHCARVCSWLK